MGEKDKGVKLDKWGYQVKTSSDKCISAINGFYDQVCSPLVPLFVYLLDLSLLFGELILIVCYSNLLSGVGFWIGA